MFSLAHISDVHLTPYLRPTVRELMSKRALGYLSWKTRRAGVHSPVVIETLMRDIAHMKVDHTALTGDLVNTATPREFEAAGKWLEAVAGHQDLTFVPGNHDAYVRISWSKGLGHFANYMSSDLRVAGAGMTRELAMPFPFVRQRRNIALVGLTSAYPAAFHRAAGRLGTAQIECLPALLDGLHQRGFYRIVLIHHPPLPGLAKPRKALEDADGLRDVLAAHGAELVLHGHNHLHMRSTLTSATGPVHVIGVPSASARPGGHKPAAAWYRHTIRRVNGEWHNAVMVRSLNPSTNTFVTETEFTLQSGKRGAGSNGE